MDRKLLYNYFNLVLFSLFTAFTATAQHTKQLYGMAQHGGYENKGVIFHYTPEIQEFHNDFSFGEIVHGKVPKSDVVDGGNGKVYGTTTLGGSNNAGVIYEWDIATNTFTEPYSFEAANGTDARGALVLYDGKFYGMTNKGGTSDGGVLFEWDPVTNIYTKKIDFNTDNGYNPIGTLTVYGGLFYGVASNGGTNNAGTLFTWDPATNVFTKKHDFSTVNGSQPIAKLAEYNSRLYGMTNAGGANGFGTIYEWNPATDTFTKKKDFTGTDGSTPNGHLTLYNNKFYGVTTLGGINAGGVIFEWNPATNTYTKKKDLGGTYVYTNFHTTKPLGSLTLNDNVFYCITSAASDGNAICRGSIFTWDPATNLIEEKATNNPVCTPVPFEGYTPIGASYSNLLVVGDYIYGTGSQYGAANAGLVFEFNTVDEIITKSVHFGATNGSYPQGSLTQLGNKLYGMTYSGGYHNQGLIFEWDMESQQFTQKVAFDGTTGSFGGGGLTYNSNKFYGLNYYGKAFAPGLLGYENREYTTLFEWDPVTNDYTPKADLQGPRMLVNHEGTADMYTLGITGIVKYTAGEDSVELLQSFDGTNGTLNAFQNSPTANSVTYYNGKYYGMTAFGGVSSFMGVIFEWDPDTNIITKKFEFTSETGEYPTGNLTLVDDVFYGLTSAGGTYGFGSLFKWDPLTNDFEVKVQLSSIDPGDGGSWEYVIHPYGTLTYCDGKLYGLSHGNDNGTCSIVGALFEYDIETEAITHIETLTCMSSPNLGGNPKFTQLTLVTPNELAILGETPQSLTACSGEENILEFELTDADDDIQAFTITSSNAALLPSQNILITGEGDVYTLAYTPLEGQTGSTIINVTANDGFGGVVSFTYTLDVVQPSTLVVVSNAALTAQQPGAQYQWINCTTGLPVTGATQQVFIAQALGSYAVIITLSNCIVTSECYDVTSLSNEAFTALDAMIIMNNQTGELNVIANADINAITIYNSIGQMVAGSAESNTINVSGLQSGVYFAIIQSDNTTWRKKFVKQ
jgi:uncharacterized repeat protein (TIGR03803 family)